MTTHKVEAETLSLVREALRGIISADWLTWEELADPEEFVRWSKPRANHALRTIAAQAQEIAELRHDIERYVETNAKLAAENERLRQALRHQDDRDGRIGTLRSNRRSQAMIPDEVIIRAGTNMLAHTDMVPLEYVRQLEKDAERYRWLRDPCSGAERAISYCLSGSMLDAAIDDAMQRTSGGDHD